MVTASSGKARQKMGAGASQANTSFVSMREVAQTRADRGPRSTSRIKTRIEEFDRVVGGGLVVGAPYLLYGNWGNGKSTLLTQVANNVIADGRKVVIITGEEADEAWLDRLIRLGGNPDHFDLIQITQNTVLDDAFKEVERIRPDLMIIDSLQTLTVSGYEGIAGDPGQVKRCMQLFCDFSRAMRITGIMIGQVTKGTQEAKGDNAVLHAPDCLLTLEGDDRYGLRMLRSPKNRHHKTDEVGIFEMTANGLEAVDDPSALFLANRDNPVIGSVACSIIEGQRPMLIEVQALVVPTNAEKPVREVAGYDRKKFNLMLMALAQHCNMRLGSFDIGLDVSAGIKITDPAIDLAVCLAIASAYTNAEPEHTIAASGQVSLLGDIRPVALADQRIQEAKRMSLNLITSKSTGTLLEAVMQTCGTTKRTNYAGAD